MALWGYHQDARRVPKPDPHLPRNERHEPEAPVATVLVALAQLIGRAAAQEHLAASDHTGDRQDDEDTQDDS